MLTDDIVYFGSKFNGNKQEVDDGEEQNKPENEVGALKEAYSKNIILFRPRALVKPIIQLIMLLR